MGPTMLTPPLRDVLDHWPDTAGEVQVCSVTPGFSGAGVFRVTSTSGTWCLRRWPNGAAGLPAARIRELHRWLAFLASEGVTTVAVPVSSRNASTLVFAHGSHWHLEPWLPGTADFHQQPTDVRLRNTATALATLHLAAERYAPSTEGAAWFACGFGASPAVIERRERLRQWSVPRGGVKRNPKPERGSGSSKNHGPSLTRRVTAQRDLAGELAASLSTLAPRIAEELERLTGVRVRLHSCLRDVWHDHILFAGDAVTGIVDPSAARTENVASDLSRLLGSLLADDQERWPIALDAYAERRSLSPDERRLIPALDRSGVALSAAHWLERMANRELNAREWERVQQLSRRVFAMR
jgi:Ser/Thr protein kinase RdoA (MazF antagonist)